MANPPSRPPGASSRPQEWAENAPTSEVSEPSAERGRGFQEGQTLPHDQTNWLIRELFRWIDYFDEQFNTSLGKLDIRDSIGAYLDTQDEINITGSAGTFGESDWNDIQFEGINDTSVLISDVLSPDLGILVGDSSGSYGIDVRSPSSPQTQGSGSLIADKLEGTTRVEGTVVNGTAKVTTNTTETDFIQGFGSGVDVLDSNQNDGDLTSGTVEAFTKLIAEKIEVSNNANHVIVVDANGNLENVRALNTAKAWARIDESSGSYSVGAGHGISSASGTGTSGEVDLTLAQDMSSSGDFAATGSIKGNLGAEINFIPNDASTVRTEITADDGTRVDDTFYVIIYYDTP